MGHLIAVVPEVVGGHIHAAEVHALAQTQHAGAGDKAGLAGKVNGLGVAVAMLQQVEDLLIQALLQAVDDIAPDELLHENGSLAALLEQSHGNVRILLRSLLALYHLNQRNELGRRIPVTDDLLGQQLLRYDLKNIQRRGVGCDNHVGCNALRQLPIQLSLGVPILYDGLLNKVRTGYSLLHGHGKAHTAENCVDVALRNLTLLRKRLQLGMQRRNSLFTGLFGARPHGDLITAHGVGLCNTGAHGSGAQYRDLLDIC